MSREVDLFMNNLRERLLRDKVGDGDSIEFLFELIEREAEDFVDNVYNSRKNILKENKDLSDKIIMLETEIKSLFEKVKN